MGENKRGVQSTDPKREENTDAKVIENKDICKVIDYFRYKVGTSLDCAKAVHVLRNSVTWYISILEKSKLLQAVSRRRDSTTGYLAKHYTADRRLWKAQTRKELDLFDESEVNHG
jgi:predicted transcriptional regulator